MTKTLSKAYLTKKVSAKTGIAQKEVKTIISVLTDEIRKSAEKSQWGEVEIEGLGTFKSVSSKRGRKIEKNQEFKRTKKSLKGNFLYVPSAKEHLLKVGDPLEYSPFRYWPISPVSDIKLKEKNKKTGQDNIER
jgi:nucleoid DNA-binding protein